MRDEDESDCPPTDVDVGVVIFALGVFADATHGVDAVEERGEFDRAPQRTVGALPAGQIDQGGVHVIVGKHGHHLTVYGHRVVNQVVVAGALIVGANLLVAQRDRPAELAGLWELPGGKVAPGEGEANALVRELDEELGVEVSVGARLGADVALSETMTLRAFLVTQTGGTVSPRDHRALRWVGADELETLDWVPADRAWVSALRAALRSP